MTKSQKSRRTEKTQASAAGGKAGADACLLKITGRGTVQKGFHIIRRKESAKLMTMLSELINP